MKLKEFLKKHFFVKNNKSEEKQTGEQERLFVKNNKSEEKQTGELERLAYFNFAKYDRKEITEKAEKIVRETTERLKKEIEQYNNSCQKCRGLKVVGTIHKETKVYGSFGFLGGWVDSKTINKIENKCASCGNEWIRKHLSDEKIEGKSVIIQNYSFSFLYFLHSIKRFCDSDMKMECVVFFSEFNIHSIKRIIYENLYLVSPLAVGIFTEEVLESFQKFEKVFDENYKQKLLLLGFKEFDLDKYKEKERLSSRLSSLIYEDCFENLPIIQK